MSINKIPTNVETASADVEKTDLIVDSDADLGLQFLAKNGRVEYTAEEESKVRWKIDLCLMPIVSSSPV